MARTLLLVDDEPLVLTGLRRGLYSMRDEWNMEFAGSGEEALQLMAKHPFDAIVTDMRMPGMDGAQLLNEVRRRSPQTIRVVLSGQCDRETIMRAVGSTHQYVSKPCDAHQLKETIRQAVALRNQLDTANLTKVVSKLKTIPSLPSSFQAMMEELGRPEPRLNRLAALVAGDMGMTAKCLQLVNSAFFGLRSPVASPLQALSLLGIDTLKSLILSSHIFSSFKPGIFSAKEVSWLWEHSFAVSICAREVAEMQGVAPRQIEDAVTAGLLHETGKLVLASCLAAEYKMVLDLANTAKISLVEAERDVLGSSYAEVGAYLLGLWGLPDPIVEAVAWHLTPLSSSLGHSSKLEFSALTAVHAACSYHGSLSHSRLSSQIQIDAEYLSVLGLEKQVDPWFAACAKAIRADNSD
jgi:HD-like signal output (HDOD) protein/CheY-like chemotaxis protein